MPQNSRLEVELQRQLDLPRIEHRARRAVERVRRAFGVRERATLAAECPGINGTEVRSAIDGVEEANVGGVEQVEGFRQELQAAPLPEREGAADAQIHRAEIVSDECIARL